jgi:hypothetical protein
VRVVHAAQRHSAFVAFSCTIILARPQDLARGPKCQVVFWVVFELELGPGRIRGESKRSLSQFMRMYLLCASLDDLRGARCWHEVRAATLHSVDQILIHDHNACVDGPLGSRAD